MANLNVSYEEMRGAAQQLRAGQETMSGTLTELTTLVDNLVESGFQTDNASLSYRDQMGQFNTSTTEAVNALEPLAAFLEQAADTLAGSDADLANSIQQ